MDGMLEATISAGSLSTLLLEGIKRLIRKFKHDEMYDFPPEFYVFMLPVLNVLMIPVLALLLVPGYTMPTVWIDYIRLLVLTVLASLVSVVGYENGVKPTILYYQRYKQMKAMKVP